MSETRVVLHDLHAGREDRRALECALVAIDWLRPREVIITGDWWEAGKASSHPPTPGDQPGPYRAETRLICDVIDWIADKTDEITFLDGNHEFRTHRKIMGDSLLAEFADQLLPEKILANRVTRHIPYKEWYEFQPGWIAVHGVSEARHAAAKHLDYFRGMSVVHGHTHRAQMHTVRHAVTGHLLTGLSAGCMCELQPKWCKTPTTWAHGFTIFHGRHPFIVRIENGHCVLPDGRHV